MPGLHLNLHAGDILQLISPKGDKLRFSTDDAAESAIDVLLVQKSGNYAALEIVAHRDIKILLVKCAENAHKGVSG